MKKRVLLVTVAAVLVIAFAVPAFAAITDAQQDEINGLFGQITELRKQLVDKYVDAGQLTKEQGDQIKTNLDQAEKYREENGLVGPGSGCGGPGTGMGGYGMMGGYGGGYGMMGGYNGGYNMMSW